MSFERPIVSVVIPTLRRPALLIRAVRSALAQDLDTLEVLVVSDGPDPELARSLHAIADYRLRLLHLPRQAGANAARNAGIDASRGQWVALLDDDDEWMPEKLRVQLALANRTRHRHPVVGCHLILRTPRADVVLPRRPPRADEHLSEYLYVRHSPFHGEGLIQTSTLFASRALFSAVPFNESIPALHETDWLLRAFARPGVGLELAPQCLVIWNAEEDRPRLTRITPNGTPHGLVIESRDWALRWAREHRGLFTARGYAAFASSVLSYLSAVRGDWRMLPATLRETVWHGRPRPIDLLVFAMVWLIPYRARRWVRDAILGRQRQPHEPREPRDVTWAAGQFTAPTESASIPPSRAASAAAARRR